MISKPTPAEVRIIIETKLADPALQSVIDDAALFVEGCPKVTTYDDARQKAIVKWVTAHMLASTNASGSGALTAKSLGDASESYARPTLGVGLSGTTYGQQAIALDPSGCLANLGKPKAMFRKVGCH